MLHLDDGLPIELGRILKDVQRRILRGAVEHDVEVVVFPEALGGAVFVRSECDLTEVGACP